MGETEEKQVKEVIENIGEYNESAWLDFKVKPYDISKENPEAMHEKKELAKDVIAMLNTKEGIGRDKFIVMGVTDTHHLKGIECMMDDSKYQSFIESVIRPMPILKFGEITVQVDGELRKFGFCCISRKNFVTVYEVKKTLQENPENGNGKKKKEGIYEGQAFMRQGSGTVIMKETDRQDLREWGQSLQFLFEAALFGQWDEANDADKRMISDVVGTEYEDWVKGLKSLSRRKSPYLLRDSSRWKILKKREIFEIGGTYLDESYLWKLERKGVGLFESEALSAEIRAGISEFFAVLFVKTNLFDDRFRFYCRNLGANIRDYLEVALSSTALLSKEAGYFCVPYLAVAQQDYFLETAGKCIETWLQSGESTGGEFRKVADCLVTALGWIAYLGEELPRALTLLVKLGTLNETALRQATDILMSWAPQTKAGSVLRIKAVEHLPRVVSGEVMWSILKALWPGVNLSRTNIMIPETLQEKNTLAPLISEEIEEETTYVKLAVRLFQREPSQEKALTLLHNLRNFGEDAFSVAEEALCEYAGKISESEKLEGWKILYSRSKEEIRESRLMQAFKPQNPLWQDAIWFDEGFLNFCKCSFRDLEEKQKEIVLKYYPSDIAQLERIADMVARPEVVGFSLAKVLSNDGQRSFMEAERPNKAFRAIKYGVFQGLDEEMKREYIEKLKRDKNEFDYLTLLVTYPLAPRYWKEAEKISDESEEYYWNKVFAYSFDGGSQNTSEDNLYLIQRMMGVQRYSDAVWVMRSMLQKKAPIDYDSLAECLLQIGEKTEEIREKKKEMFSAFAEVIMLLPETGIKENLLISVEKEFCEELRRYPEGAARAFNAKLARDADYFAKSLLSILADEVLRRNGFAQNSEDKSENVGSLFRQWNKVPGVDAQGEWREELFISWIGNVKKRFLAYPEIDEIAQYYIGHCIALAQDRSGEFYLERALARILDDDDNDAIRKGYFFAMLNTYSGNWSWENGRDFFRSGIKWSEEKGYLTLAGFLKKIVKEFDNQIIRYMQDCRALNFMGAN